MILKEAFIVFTLFSITKYLNAVNCGLPKIQPHPFIRFKIVGGTEAIPYSWPWQAYIRFFTIKEDKTCGGTLINDNWILTAAHCFVFHGDLIEITIKLGIFDHAKCPTQSTHYHIYKRQFTTNTFMHPGFNESNNHNDIALIKLPKKVNYNDHISPVCLPRNDLEVNVVGKELVATGWGQTTTGSTYPLKLRQVVIRIQPDNDPLKFGCFLWKFFDPNIQICAGIPAIGGHNRKGTCYGDSGGPLVRKNKITNKWYQYGVISYGPKICEIPNKEAEFFTRVAYYCDWIEQTVGGTICEPEKKITDEL